MQLQDAGKHDATRSQISSLIFEDYGYAVRNLVKQADLLF